jgi:hypothetical protein
MPDGSYWLLDLPAGLYRIEATVPALGSRYGTGRIGPVRVWATRDSSGRIKLDPADIAVPPTSVHGRVTRQDTGDPVANAQVRLRGDPAATASGTDGRYALVGLVAGNPTVECSAPGLQIARMPVSVTPGQDQAVDFVLVSVS